MHKINFTLILMGVIALVACNTAKKPVSEPRVVSIDFNADSAFAFCEAQCDFGARTMNSDAHERCAEWIASKFRQYGYTIHLQQADLRGYDGTVLRSTNIIAQQAPTGLPVGAASSEVPVSVGLPDETAPLARILLCAHWDSRPWADNDPDSANWRKPVMAANDGASGVAVMLEVARLLQQHDSAGIAVDFICFDAEDWGIPQWADESDGDSWALGAQYWAAHPSPLRPADYQYGILLDMVGGQGARFFQEGYSLRYARSTVDKVWQAAHVAGYGSTFPTQEQGWITDDHVPVNETAGIPCIDIINHYPDCENSTFGPTWHTVSDDMQHIDHTTLKAVGQTLIQLIFTEK
jgi:hypothetical protein